MCKKGDPIHRTILGSLRDTIRYGHTVLTAYWSREASAIYLGLSSGIVRIDSCRLARTRTAICLALPTIRVWAKLRPPFGSDELSLIWVKLEYRRVYSQRICLYISLGQLVCSLVTDSNSPLSQLAPRHNEERYALG